MSDPTPVNPTMPAGRQIGRRYTQITYYWPERRIDVPTPFATEAFSFEEGKGEIVTGMSRDEIHFPLGVVTIPHGWLFRAVLTGRADAQGRIVPDTSSNVVPFPPAAAPSEEPPS
jgi:hypothetical protein